LQDSIVEEGASLGSGIAAAFPKPQGAKSRHLMDEVSNGRAEEVD
jgi:hypothetical protein